MRKVVPQHLVGKACRSCGGAAVTEVIPGVFLCARHGDELAAAEVELELSRVAPADRAWLPGSPAGARAYVVKAWQNRVLVDEVRGTAAMALGHALELRQWKDLRARLETRDQETLASAVGRKYGREMVFVESLRAVAECSAAAGDHRLQLALTTRTAYLLAVFERVIEPPADDAEITRAEKRLGKRAAADSPVYRALKKLLIARGIPGYPRDDSDAVAVLGLDGSALDANGYPEKNQL